MHSHSEWRLVLAGFVLCVIISFARSILRKRGAAFFDIALSLLTIGLLVYVLR
ncbi:MAG: hypothetical protein JO052_23725 [Bradyrhizobium sp.]|nr:hypothetical protein [Bradyrhizobium sp.]